MARMTARLVIEVSAPEGRIDNGIHWAYQHAMKDCDRCGQGGEQGILYAWELDYEYTGYDEDGE